MPLLTKTQITEADTVMPAEIVEVPEWGGSVNVVGMSGAEKDAWEASRLADPKKPNRTNIRGALAAACIRDENGQRVFSDADADMLGKKSCVALDRVVTAALRLSGMVPDEAREADLKN